MKFGIDKLLEQLNNIQRKNYIMKSTTPNQTQH